LYSKRKKEAVSTVFQPVKPDYGITDAETQLKQPLLLYCLLMLTGPGSAAKKANTLQTGPVYQWLHYPGIR